jgi:hypothetical protein
LRNELNDYVLALHKKHAFGFSLFDEQIILYRRRADLFIELTNF